MRPGTSSRAARRGSADRNGAAGALVVLAVLVSAGLIAVSVTLNARMAYRSADSVFDAWVYALAAGLADALKAYAPFAAHAGWRNRDAVAVVAAVAVLLTVTAYTFSAEVGFALLHRVERQSQRATAMERRDDARKSLVALESARALLGNGRTVSEIDAAIARQLASFVPGRGRSVADWSQSCALARRETGEACAAVLLLREERATAHRRTDVDAEIAWARERLAALPVKLGGQDPQSEALSMVAALVGVDVKDRMDVLLSVLVAAVIEVGSGLGLYLATTPRRGGVTARGDDAPRPARNRRWHARRRLATPGRQGRVDTYAVARLRAMPGGTVTGEALYQDYRDWCVPHDLKPLEYASMLSAMTTLASEVGIKTAMEGGKVMFADIAIGETVEAGSA